MARILVTDIIALFRSGDIACMTRLGVKLDDADWMCDPAAGQGFSDHGNARSVFSALSGGSMPPDGAWPKSRLQTYEQWMRDGFPGERDAASSAPILAAPSP